MANEIIDYVSSTIDEMKVNNGLVLPKNYSAGNALNAAYLILSDRSKGQSVLDKVKGNQITKVSLVRALQDMVIQGLSPAKNQGYFIQYGKQLAWSRSYFGSVAIVKRQKQIKGEPFANVIYQDDVFETGMDDHFRTTVTKFEHKFENQDKPIVGAFAGIEFEDGHIEYTIMTKKEIDQSWSKSKMRSGGPKAEFPQEMAKRTVLSRAAKMVINTSDDNDMIIESVNRTTEQEFDDSKPKDVTPNKQMLDDLIENDEAPEEASTADSELDPANLDKEMEKDDGRNPENLFENQTDQQ